MTYVDGFLIPLHKDQVDAYRAIAEKAAEVWMEHGALEFRECVGDDLDTKDADGNIVTTFASLTKLADDETVMFSWIVYRSKEERDAVNKKVMADPRITEMGPDQMPFDPKRMAFGGFRALVERTAVRNTTLSPEEMDDLIGDELLEEERQRASHSGP